LEPVIVELERQRSPVVVIAHQVIKPTFALDIIESFCSWSKHIGIVESELELLNTDSTESEAIQIRKNNLKSLFA
jgi:hypothetical protein